MKLTFQQPYLSLVSLNDTELPAFTVITGKNGSGKTHLLRAIERGHVHVDASPDWRNEVRFYDWNNLVPNKAAAFDSQTLTNERSNLYSKFNSLRRKQENTIINAARSVNVPHERLGNTSDLVSLSTKELATMLGGDAEGERAYKTIQQANETATRQLYKAANRTTPNFRAIQAVEEGIEKSLFAVDKDEFMESLPPGWGEAALFQQSFSRLFVAYRDLELENRIKKLAFDDGDSHIAPLNKEEFVDRYNVPPWDFVNQTLREANLDFEIDAPARTRNERYLPSLTKITSGVPVDFDSLSSGEKVLMSFTLCVYYATDRRQLSVFPKLLLLDEVDAPLHPSMSRSIVNTIRNTLVSEYGINVILTTHSPSTVAVAPGQSIHVMVGGEPGVQKVSKGRAINLLTEDVPTLAIGFDGRRQVFVESNNDSSIYEKLYQALKTEIPSERSLTFIAVGRRVMNETSDQNTGCDQVRRIVNSLAKAGNLSVLGLIDWDGKNDSSERVIVLADHQRYGLENCVYDPLLLAASIARDVPTRMSELGLTDTESYIAFQSMEVSRLREIAMRIERAVLGESSSHRLPVEYHGGFSIELSQSYLHMMAHSLEEAILQKFPEFRKYNNRPGDLMRRIVSTVVKENPRLVPLHLVNTLQTLLDLDIMCKPDDSAN